VAKVDSFGSRSVKPTFRGVERNHSHPPSFFKIVKNSC
jgi:hypothetical protein